MPGLRMAYGGQILESNRIVLNNTITDFDMDKLVKPGVAEAPVTPTAGGLLGMYNGGPRQDQQIKDVLGSYPDVASTYYQPDQLANQANELARLRRGTSTVMTFSSKNTAGSPTQSSRWVDYANDDSAAVNWVDARINSARTLSEQAAAISTSLGFNVYVFMALEHEYSVKSNPANSSNYVVTGAAADPSICAQVQNRFIARCRALAPLVRPIWWEGCYRKSFIEAALAEMTQKPDVLLLDPYTNGGAYESAEACWKAQFDWMRGLTDYAQLGSPALGIGEFGIDLSEFSDAQGGMYYTDLRVAMANLELAMGIQFNSNSGPNGDHAFLVGDFPATRLAFSKSLASSSPAPPQTTDLTAIGATTTSVGDPDASGTLFGNSGLVVSTKNSGASGRVFWSHNDHGPGGTDGPADVYAIDDTAGSQIISTVSLTGVTNGLQWEDISTGPGPDPAKTYVYVGKIGAGAGTTRYFYRFEEPDITAGQSPVNHTVPVVSFSYTTPYSDSEGFFVDPVSGDLFLFEKINTATRPATGGVYRYPGVSAMSASQSITGAAVASVRSLDASTNNGGITAADISDDGRVIVIGNYLEMWGWNRNPDTETVSQVFAAAPAGHVHTLFTDGWGGESIAIDKGPQPGRLYGLSEGPNSTLKYATLSY